MANTTGLGDTIYAAVKKALEDANGSSGGGGGSSDLTTAHVTITGTRFGVTGNGFQVCTCIEQEGISSTFPSPMGEGMSIEFDAVLYKGGAALMTEVTVTATSGAIQQLGEGAYLITGDCSITTE